LPTGSQAIMPISLNFPLTVAKRDYIFNQSFCFQNERKDAKDG
jgi:hypothetical protein